MNRAVRWLLDLIYPPRCIICHRILPSSRTDVCSACLDSLPEYDGADPKVRFADRCAATFFYRGAFKESFHRFKFGGRKQYAVRYGTWMAGTIRDKLSGKFDIITWAPVSKKRRRSRGYDQAELLARRIGAVLDTEVRCCLQKHTDTRPNSSLTDASARSANVSGVYEPVDAAGFAGKRVLLIDDIVTTGATLSECSRVLLTAGAESVVCAALAAATKND